MAVDARLMPPTTPAATTPEPPQTVRSSASTPSLRSRDGTLPMHARMDGGGNVRVVVRVRAFLKRELERRIKCLVEMDPISQQTTLLSPDDNGQIAKTPKSRKVIENKKFTFDSSFWSHDTDDAHYAHQEDVYNSLGEEFLDHNFEGYHTCIFAYGQTGSGKSYTMMGTPEQPGLIPRTCEDLFERIEAAHNENANIAYNVRVSYFEVYNEHVRDLLVAPVTSGAPNYLKIRESPTEGPYVKDLTEVPVRNISEILRYMKNGDASRTTASTKMNDTSSRSHAVFTIMLRHFVKLIAQGSFTSKRSSSEKDVVVIGWLKDQLAQYKDVLLMQLLKNEDAAPSMLTLCMKVLKTEGDYLRGNDEYNFPRDFLESIITTLFKTRDESLVETFVEEYAEQYDDIRFFSFRSVRAILEKTGEEETPGGLFNYAFALLSPLDGVPESTDSLEDFYVTPPQKKTHPVRSVHKHKREGQDAWLALMRGVDSKEQRKRILDIVSTVVAPWFTKPELLSDFLAHCYNAGGTLSLLALSGVFYLINERNLDYPSFYPKLYSLLDRDILHSKHRSRFFRLLDTFLASTHLPAALVASFVKRLSRLTLNAPPSAIAFVVPWIYNLLKKHPQCTFMLHRVTRDEESKRQIKNQGIEDPFLPDESDPMATNAIDSSLWELVQLQSHYHPNVATIAKIISEQFTKHSYNMEDFLDHSYASLLEAEKSKTIRKAPVVEFHIPKKIFFPQDSPATTPDTLLVKLWDFSGSTERTTVA